MQNLTFYIAYNDELKAKCDEVKQKVFMEEQDLAKEIVFDDIEKWAVHFVVLDEELPVATARMLVNENDSVKVGRVAVIKEYRGQGVGKLLMHRIASYCQKNATKKIKLSSQATAKPFYEKLGYIQTSEEYCEAGIPHYMMELQLSEV
ncbi:MAG: GNAT family N-acetyltransferase [bacterium]